LPRGACRTSRWAGADECTRPSVFRNGQLANLVGAANGLGAPWRGCWQLAPEGVILQALGSRVTGPAAVMAATRAAAACGCASRSPGRAGRPCAVVRCAPGSPRSSPASTDSAHKPLPSSAPGISWHPLTGMGFQPGGIRCRGPASPHEGGAWGARRPASWLLGRLDCGPPEGAGQHPAGRQPAGPAPGGSSGGARLIAAHITFIYPGEIPGARAYLLARRVG
jgi:hypothetical protein